jgi:hypothetical protein
MQMPQRMRVHLISSAGIDLKFGRRRGKLQRAGLWEETELSGASVREEPVCISFRLWLPLCS